MTRRVLSHIRVLDMGRVLAAPLTAQLLGDLGAEVIKVERPGTGDEFRFSMPKVKDETGESIGESAFFCSFNRGKKSITVNLTHPDGLALVREMADKCDVLIENYKVGDLARRGLGYEDLSKTNPRLIYCSITGFGQSGPYRSRPAYDPILQAMGGLMAVTGNPDDQPGGGPVKIGPSIIDILTAQNGSSAILAALLQREQTGHGQHIDLALMDSCVAALTQHAIGYLNGGDEPQRMGTDTIGNSPSGMYRCSDGAIMLVVGNEGQFARLCETVGCAHLIGDSRFTSKMARVANRDLLRRELEKGFSKFTVKAALAALEKAVVVAGKFNEFPEVFEDPQVKHRKLVVDVPHPKNAKMRLIASPIRLPDSPISYAPPPLLGEHTDWVLKQWLGKTDAEIQKLRDAGAI